MAIACVLSYILPQYYGKVIWYVLDQLGYAKEEYEVRHLIQDKLHLINRVYLIKKGMKLMFESRKQKVGDYSLKLLLGWRPPLEANS